MAGDRVYAAWLETPIGVFVNHSDDRGATWQPVEFDVTLGVTANWPTIAARGDSAWVFWTNGVTNELRMSRTSDGGQTWLSNPVTISDPGAFPARSHSVIANDAGLFVAWRNEDSRFLVTDVDFSRSLDGGATWLAQTVRLDRTASLLLVQVDEETLLLARTERGIHALDVSRETSGGIE